MKKLIAKFKRLNSFVKLVVLAIILAFITVPTVTFSRYVYKTVVNKIYSSKQFYFTSNLLDKNGTVYPINSWSGADIFQLSIDVNSILNEYKHSDVDISYDIEYSCTGDVQCSISKTSGIIRAIADNPINNNVDTFQVTLRPNHEFNVDEEAEIYVKVNSTSPFKEELSARFVLSVQKVGLSYKIKDSANSDTLRLIVSNSLYHYIVKTAFGSHRVGDIVGDSEYESLSEADKDKCESMGATINFDPRITRLDLTNRYYLQALKNNAVRKANYYMVHTAFANYRQYQLISTSQYNSLNASNKNNVFGPFEYVTGIDIKINATSSADIVFYKNDYTVDYTYPLVNNSSIINVS